ncbi:hypothetical protein [Bradyrhizobium sp. CIAT3101]|uniref:hypothetical protein n=1 Tax=Bradyrhizobium sp. CIAT3101 TaxID=439387 RepID=UPI0032C213B0
MLSGLRTHLMEPELFKEFCDEFTREVNRLRIDRGADLAAMRNELPRIERELGKLVAAIKAGGPIEAIVEDMKRLEARKVEVREKLANGEEPPPLLHPNMAEIYRQRVAALYESLQSDDDKGEAAEVFRTLVDQVTLMPEAEELAIVLRGDLAAILRFAAGKKNPDFLSEAGALNGLLSQASVVAGIGFEPMTLFVVSRRLAQAELSSTTFIATHLSAQLSRRFNDLSINLFTSGQPSATMMSRPSSFLD